MNYIEQVDIFGFWGSKNVHLDLHQDLNFLIGPNGSGKTTVINLLAAVLRADIPALYSQQFDRVVIKLKSKIRNQKPLIDVHKTTDSQMGHFTLHFNVRSKRTDKGDDYVVNGPFDERLYRDPRYPRSRRLIEEGARLSRILAAIIEVNWLSIHRTTLEPDHRTHRDESFESSVDQKLHQMSSDFSHYFSLLSSLAESESKSFQEHVLLSLLDQDHDVDDIFRQIDRGSASKATIVTALKALGVDDDKATRSVSAHLSRLSKAEKKWRQGTTFNLEDAITFSDALRVSEMIDKWRQLQEKRQSIFRPRFQFETIINKLLTGKQVYFDARNVPKVRLESADEYDVGVLSSGEKQLFILLGEALLQEGRQVVFISDEPELSLHVTWQSSLFENVRELNNSCQVISATHSPDIVGSFQDRVIKVADCISDV